MLIVFQKDRGSSGRRSAESDESVIGDILWPSRIFAGGMMVVDLDLPFLGGGGGGGGPWRGCLAL
jgi:hypothetical protein